MSLPRFCLHPNLSTWSELSPHLTTTIVSSSLSTTTCWRRWRRRATMSSCGWDLTCQTSLNHLSMKLIVWLLFDCSCHVENFLNSSSLGPIVVVMWKIFYLSSPIVRTMKILLADLIKSYIVNFSFKSKLICQLESIFVFCQRQLLFWFPLLLFLVT